MTGQKSKKHTLENMLHKLSDDSYRFDRNLIVGSIQGVDAFLVWRYVRANPNYKAAFESLAQQVHNLRDAEEEEFLVSRFLSDWGMSMLVDPSVHLHPEELKFNLSPVHVLKRNRSLHSEIDRLWEWGNQAHILLVNRYGDPKLIHAQIDALLETPKILPKKIKASNWRHLADNAITQYVFECHGRYCRAMERQYEALAGAKLQQSQAERKIKTFMSYACVSPWCFSVSGY